MRIRLLIFSLPVCCIAVACAVEEPPPESDALSITSKTEYYSANLLLKEERGETVTDKEREKDKQREKLGIGETTMLTLSGKDALIGNPDQLKWEIKPKQGLATIKIWEGTKMAVLTINKNLTQTNGENGRPNRQEVTVCVTTPEGGYKTITFEIVFPITMTGRHTKTGNTTGSIVTDPEYRMPVNGDTVNAGASAKLEVIIGPTDVSFRKIDIKEQNKGFVNGHKPSLAKDHQIKTATYSPKPKNIIVDNVGSQRSLEEIERGNHQLDQSWAWICGWNTYDDALTAKHPIITVHQQFHYKRVNHARQEQAVEVTVSKFGCTVRRNTLPENKHSFTPQRP